jgi:hypothetical protein
VALRVDGKPPVALDGDDARLLFVTEL